MAQTDQSSSQSSRLSAEAESFVPGKMRSRHQSGGSMDRQKQKQLNTQQLKQLPSYVTSCYPFVDGDPGRNPRASMSLHGQGKPQTLPAGMNVHHRMPASMPGGYTFPGSRPPGPQGFVGMGGRPSSRPPGYSPTRHGAGYPPQVLPQAQLHPPLPAHPIAGFPPYYPPQLGGFHPAQMNPMSRVSPQGWGSTTPGTYSPECGSPFSPPGYYNQQLASASSVDSTDWPTVEKTKSSDRKSKKKKSSSSGGGGGGGGEGSGGGGGAELPSNMVSIGIQNEVNLPHNSNALQPKKKSRTKTIICMDTAIQTEFSDEIANLTLAEKPNSLYCKDRVSWLQHYGRESSTDSEEVDSDSGYSSPMHRRNQASNGTHPAAGLPLSAGLAYMPPHNATGSAMHKHSYPLYVNPNSVPGGFAYPAANPSPAGVVTSGFDPAFIQSFQQQGMPTNVLTVAPAVMPPGVQTPLCNGVSASIGSSNNNKMPYVRGSGSGSSTAPTQSATSAVALKAEPEEDYAASSSLSGKKKRRRSRRKKKRGSGEDIGALSDEPLELHRAHSSSNVSRTSTVENESGLHFEDEEEFPNLSGDVPDSSQSTSISLQANTTNRSYSDILKSQVSPVSQESSLSGVEGFAYNVPLSASNATSDSRKESKIARKRRKRREQASRAADEELAEISIEQQVLKEMSHKSQKPGEKSSQSTASSSSAAAAATPAPPPPAPPAPPPPPVVKSSGRKSQQPISLNIADMISALEKQQEQQQEKKMQQIAKGKDKQPSVGSAPVVNPLDSSAVAKRGKEREVPKPKKPSPLKKVILKEREERKRLRLLEETNPLSPGSSNSSQLVSVAAVSLDSDLSQDGISSKASSMEYGAGTPASADMSPISQNSPISMSPLSGSPLSSGVNSPIATNNSLGQAHSTVLLKIHSRRFREYCNQVLDKEIDNCCTLLLQDLVRFQDRLYHKDPVKAKAKRRIVLGLREVTKHLKLRKIKCVIISPNLERIQSKGGLDDALNKIIQICKDQQTPFVFALGRRALGRACAKLVPVSVVGIFNYEGTEEHFNKLMDLTQQARSTYDDMVEVLEKEMDSGDKNNTARTTGTGFQQLFPHLGHSRTPSACSAISFTSSILSEPISENYPHSEPETDSRGYEIVRSSTVDAKVDEEAKAESESRSDSPGSGKVTIVEALNEIDEGHEADTEDDLSSAKGQSRDLMNKTPVMSNGGESYSQAEDLADDDTVEELPHIDSIHSSVVDLNAEILSQHSSKTLDLNATDVSSTHSSRTLEYNTAGQTTPDRSSRNMGSAPDLHDASGMPSGGGNSSSAQRVRTLDKERIESWVAETQKQIEKLVIGTDSEPVMPGGSCEQEVQHNCNEADDEDDDDDDEDYEDDYEEDDDEEEEEEGEEDGEDDDEKKIDSESEPTLKNEIVEENKEGEEDDNDDNDDDDDDDDEDGEDTSSSDDDDEFVDTQTTVTKENALDNQNLTLDCKVVENVAAS